MTIATKLARDTFCVARHIIDVSTRAQFFDFAERRLVAPRDPGNNLLLYMSEQHGEEFETDFWLVRAVLNRQIVNIASDYFEKAAGTRDFNLRCTNLLVRHFDRAWSSRDLYVPYHQDGAALPQVRRYFPVPHLIPKFRMINVWTPLFPRDGIGLTSPGIDIFPKTVRRLLPIKSVKRSTSTVYAGIEVKDTALGSEADRPITPQLALGDVLMFNELCPHRTQCSAAVDQPRVSAEIRLIADHPTAREEQRNGMAYATVRGNVIRWPSRWRMDGGRPIAIEMRSATLF